MLVRLKALKPKETDFEPRTLGEHVRRCRLVRKLTREEAARLLGVNAWTLLNWETGRTEPAIGIMPGILTFLGYDPFQPPRTLPERMLAKRRALGWSIKATAKRLGVDERTWSTWERTGEIQSPRFKKLVAGFLDREENNS